MLLFQIDLRASFCIYQKQTLFVEIKQFEFTNMLAIQTNDSLSWSKHGCSKFCLILPTKLDQILINSSVEIAWMFSPAMLPILSIE